MFWLCFVRLDFQGRLGQTEINDITSIYGKDSYLGYTKWVDKILTGDEEKLKAWIKSLPENDSRGVSKSMLSKLQEKLHEVLVGKDNTHISNTQEKSEENDKISFRITPEEDARWLDGHTSLGSLASAHLTHESAA